MGFPTVSIIIPVFNRPNLVADAIESVILQTFENWELIVVDDGSTDNTWEVLESYAAKDERIRVYKRDREQKGAPTCRNIGAGLAKGQYLIFWDSDDLLAPWCIEERVRFMKENPELDFGLFQLLNLDTKLNKLTLRCNTEPGDYLERFLTFQTSWGTPAVIWVKSFFEKIVGWDEEALSWQDGEIHIRALNRNPKFEWGSFIPDGIVRSGWADNSITQDTDNFVRVSNRLIICSKLYSNLNDYYKGKFKHAVKGRVWFETYYWALGEKQKISTIACKLKLFTKNEKAEYFLSYSIYTLARRIPLIKGVYYRLLIGKHFKVFEFWKRIKLSNYEKMQIIKKIEEHPQQGTFLKILKEFL